MPQSLPATHDAARSRVRNVINTLLLIMITAMIVRDIFARRWGSTAAPASGVTQRSR
jgi:hypothetical protein